MNWFTSLQYFIAIIEHNGFSNASRYINASPSSLSKHLSWLEARLETRLIYRTSRQMQVTDAGKQFYNHAKEILERLAEAKENIKQQSQYMLGDLRVWAPVHIGENIVAPLACKFSDKYPKIKLDLIINNAIKNIIYENIHIGITMADINDPLLYRKILTKKKHAIFAAPKYLQEYGIPKNPEDLIYHNCLINTFTMPDRTWSLREERVPVRGNFIANNPNVLLEAAIGGKGLLLTTTDTVSDAVKKGKLCMVMKKYASMSQTVYLYVPMQHRYSSKIKAFSEFLEANIPKVI